MINDREDYLIEELSRIGIEGRVYQDIDEVFFEGHGINQDKLIEIQGEINHIIALIETIDEELDLDEFKEICKDNGIYCL